MTLLLRSVLVRGRSRYITVPSTSRRSTVINNGGCPGLSLVSLPGSSYGKRGFATKRQQRAAAAAPASGATPNDSLNNDHSSASSESKPDYSKPPPKAQSVSSSSNTTTTTTTAAALGASQWSASLASQPHLIRTTTEAADWGRNKLLDTSFQLDAAHERLLIDIDDTHDSESTGGLDLEQAFHPDLFDPAIHLPSAPVNWSGYEAPTPLQELLLAQIGVSGQPLTVAAFMQAALTHPQFGYYVQAGKGGGDGGGINTAAADRDNFEDDDYDQNELSSSDQNIIGPTGDFVTAPEVSSIFTETLGIWLYTQHQLLPFGGGAGAKAWQWLECGPGAGTLSTDLIRFAQQLPDFGSTLQNVHLVEASPVLRSVQRTKLETLGPDIQFVFGDEPTIETEETSEKVAITNDKAIHVHWHDSLAMFQAWQLENECSLPIFTIWQEFLDALPVYSFEKTTEGWRERLVDVVVRAELMDEDELKREEEAAKQTTLKDVKKPRFRLVLAPGVTPPLKTLLHADEQGNLPNEKMNAAPIGSVIEVNPEGILLAQDLAQLLEKQGGAGLIIDYGQEGSTDSIRAFRKHQQVHFLSRAGQVDVTADVDFAAIRHGINALKLPGVQAFGPTTQGQFLVSMGIQERVIQLIESNHTTEEEADNLYESLMRLAGPEEMGERYKVLAITRKKEGIFEPPGFDYTAKQA